MKASGVVEANLAGSSLQPQALYLSPGGRFVVFAGADSAKSAEQVVGIWNTESNKVANVARLQQRAAIVHLRLRDELLHAIDADGKVFAWRLPDPATGAPLQVKTIPADQIAMERAIMLLGLGDPRSALTELRKAASGAQGASRFFHAYVQSLADKEDGESFLRRMDREGIKYAGEDAVLKAAEDLTAAEVTYPAVDMLLYWLEGARPGTRPEAAVATGLELVLQLSESDDEDGEAYLLERLHEVYPADEGIRQELKERQEAEE
jgi:hypothetical protein